jgi:hypothetical protein
VINHLSPALNQTFRVSPTPIHSGGEIIFNRSQMQAMDGFLDVKKLVDLIWHVKA